MNDEPMFMIIPTASYQMLLKAPELTPRQKWKADHRAMRMAAKGKREPLLRGQVSSIEGIRIKWQH